MNKATKVFMSVFVLTLALVSSSFAQNTLFFSQYNEGGSNNKALEIYNPTADTVWLSGYAFPNVSNDPTTPGEFEYWNDFPDSAYILPGDVYVIVHPDADSVMKAAGDYEFTYLSNGDDGFYLVEGDSAAGSSFTVIDKIGTWDADPGSGWDVAGVTNATADHTLYRKPTVMTGNTDWAASAGTDAVSSEWIVAGKDVFTGLGDHSVDKTTTIDEITENVVNAWNFDDMSLGVWSVDTNPDYGVGGTVEVAADIAASGDYSARVMAVDTLEKVGIITFDIDGLGIQEGDTMYFRVWVSAADLAKFDALQPFTQSGNDWSQWSDAYYESSSLTADTWTWLKVGIPAPKDGKFQKAGLQVTGSAATVAETPVVYVDDITVVRPGGVQPDPVNVTFTVNTSTIPDTVNADNYSLYINGAIKGAGAGQSFVGGETITWDANATATLDNVGGDYWTATYQMMPGDTLLYKYRYLNAVTEASDDENGFATDVNPAGWDTRGIVVTSDTVLNVDYFNDSSDSPAPADLVPFESKEDSVTVMFRVNVGGQVQVGSFDPETDQVGLRGNPEFFNNPSDWGSTGTFLEQQAVNGDNYWYTGVVRMQKDSVANLSGAMGYKFVLETADGTTWESTPDRFVTVPSQDTTIHWVYFSDTPPSSAKVINTTLNFEVNVGILEGLGLFNSSLDSVYATGTFNNWANTANQLAFNSFSGTYQGTGIPFKTAVGTTVEYKYYIRWDESRDDEGSANYLAGISANNDGWEEPGVTGGGNRTFDIEDLDDQPTRSESFNGVEPLALMTAQNVTGGAITVTFNYDMNPAMADSVSTPFNPATDSVFLIVDTPFFALTNGIQAYDSEFAVRSLEARDKVMFTDDDADGVYTLDLPLQLPTLNHIGFRIAYGQPTAENGNWVINGNGYAAGRRHYQYVQPIVAEGGAVSWPATYSMPTLSWKPEDLDWETPPNYTATNSEIDGDVAKEFKLMQNYPNPFNPTTNISFTLPDAAPVKLTVYNVLGQQVSTLISNKTMTAGTHTVAFDASALSSGIYIYRLEAGSFVSNKRMTLIK